jgi:hypothetical protein
MDHIIHLVSENAGVLAIVVTVGVGLLLFCCLSCTKCSCREKDDLFRQRHV